MKHRLRGHAALAACASLLALCSGEATAQRPGVGQVRTAMGTLAGTQSGSGLSFRGVPYALPPIGPLRWRSPQPATPWSGVKRADTFAPPCAQAPLRGMTQLSDASREDCLYLNIWTPEPSHSGKRPVMVWIHGGGFANGSGTSPTFDGEQFAARGVILVTINYRLGIFGFLAHPELTAQSAHKSSGNFGLEDQIAALQWVRANIGSFGGDPSNVTIFGQSAGGASVLDLAGSPRAQGLFSKAIIQSGAARQAIAPATLADAEQRGTAFAGGRSIAQLRSLDATALVKLLESAPRDTARFGPSIDGYVLTQDPATALRRRSGPPLPLLIGSNAREGLGTPDPDQFAPMVRQAFSTNADKALQFYGVADGGAGSVDPLLGTPAQQFSTDSTFRCGNVQIAQISAATGAPTWQYQFEQAVPGREQQGAAHSVEVPYVFGTLSPTGFSGANYGPADRRLSALMTQYWANFATTGNPNGPGLPEWPKYTSDRKAFVRFASALPHDVEVAADLRGPLCRLFPDSFTARRE